MVNGLDDARALEHMHRVQEVDRQMEGRIRVFTGIEADILADGSIDLSDDVLAQLDIVIASMHSFFAYPAQQQTERMLRAIENPYVRILGHGTGRMLLRREPAPYDITAVLRRASELGVAIEHNANPHRLDLCDTHLRLARELGCRIVINTDAHHTSEFGNLRFGIKQLRRAWLTPAEVINTREPDAFLAALRPRA
jgi:DNA polymerase (family 10)